MYWLSQFSQAESSKCFPTQDANLNGYCLVWQHSTVYSILQRLCSVHNTCPYMHEITSAAVQDTTVCLPHCNSASLPSSVHSQFKMKRWRTEELLAEDALEKKGITTSRRIIQQVSNTSRRSTGNRPSSLIREHFYSSKK